MRDFWNSRGFIRRLIERFPEARWIWTAVLATAIGDVSIKMIVRLIPGVGSTITRILCLICLLFNACMCYVSHQNEKAGGRPNAYQRFIADMTALLAMTTRHPVLTFKAKIGDLKRTRGPARRRAILELILMLGYAALAVYAGLTVVLILIVLLVFMGAMGLGGPTRSERAGRGAVIVYCPHCGGANDPDADKCEYCGERL